MPFLGEMPDIRARLTNVVANAFGTVVAEYLEEVKKRRLELLAKTKAAVKERLTKEINSWDHRAEEIKLQEQTCKANAPQNSNESRKRADILQGRLEKRMEELVIEATLFPLPPIVLGGLLVIPPRTSGQSSGPIALADLLPITRHPGRCCPCTEGHHGHRTLARLRAGGPRTVKTRLRHRVPHPKHGPPALPCGERPHHRGRHHQRHAKLNSLFPEQARRLHSRYRRFHARGSAARSYIREPFQREPDFGVTSVNYDFSELIARAGQPT